MNTVVVNESDIEDVYEAVNLHARADNPNGRDYCRFCHAYYNDDDVTHHDDCVTHVTNRLYQSMLDQT